MSKIRITDNEKIKAIESYIQGEMGFGEISNKYGIPKSTLRHWICRYKTFGVDGLQHRKHNDTYSVELKKQAVEEYLAGYLQKIQNSFGQTVARLDQGV